MRRRRPHDYRALFLTGRWFAGLPDDLQGQLLDAAAVRAVAAGEVVVARGGEPGGLYGVVDGAIRIAGRDGGRDVFHMLIEPPSWFGELSAIDGQPVHQASVAEVDGALVCVARPALDRLLEREPRWWQHLARLVAHRLRLALLALEDSAQAPPRIRLARRLAMLVAGYGDHTLARRTVALRQEQLAQMLGLSRQTANGALKDLEARGLIKVAYGEVEILDAAGLRALCGL